MTAQSIPLDQLQARVHDLWANQWLLLTAGDFASGHFNTMTVGWGSLGTMWGKPFAQVVVRPVRYTFEFIERYDTFTLCAFGPSHRRALQLLGTRSGRDGGKISDAGLTPTASTEIAAPGFAEAELTLQCRKIYWDDMKPENFLDPAIEGNYPRKDYHRIYFGQILAALGVGAFGG